MFATGRFFEPTLLLFHTKSIKQVELIIAGPFFFQSKPYAQSWSLNGRSMFGHAKKYVATLCSTLWKQGKLTLEWMPCLTYYKTEGDKWTSRTQRPRWKMPSTSSCCGERLPLLVIGAVSLTLTLIHVGPGYPWAIVSRQGALRNGMRMNVSSFIKYR